jgi:hypothetical protein
LRQTGQTDRMRNAVSYSNRIIDCDTMGRMGSLPRRTVNLKPHPSAPGEAVRAIEASIARDPQGLLRLTYTVTGEVSRLQIATPEPPRRADELWRHTCFEAFIVPGAGPAYIELNFSPSGAWASYAFSDYRERGAECEAAEAPSVTVERGAQAVRLAASIRLACARDAAPLRLALAAVIEEAGGGLSYWALRHPPGKPDFHHPDGFALRI